MPGRWSRLAARSRSGSAQHAPNPLTGHRAIEDPIAPEGVGYRVVDGGKHADRRGLSAALHAERIGRAPRVVEVQIERRKIVRPRQGVIHERSADALTRFRIEYRML